MRNSTITTNHDAAGDYEVEIFDCPNPKGIIVTSHGNGVRRWDGEKFFYAVAEQYSGYVVMLVDQNQQYKDGCQLNDLQIMIDRVQSLVKQAATDYPAVPVTVMGHSMGCGIIARMNLDDVAQVVFVAPTAGDQTAGLLKRYGPNILEGQVVTTSDGLTKFITKEFVASVQGIVWEREYAKLLERYEPVYVFASGSEEIVGDARLEHEHMPFAGYTVIPNAKHNLAGEPLQTLFTELAPLLPA